MDRILYYGMQHNYKVRRKAMLSVVNALRSRTDVHDELFSGLFGEFSYLENVLCENVNCATCH